MKPGGRGPQLAWLDPDFKNSSNKKALVLCFLFCFVFLFLKKSLCKQTCENLWFNGRFSTVTGWLSGVMMKTYNGAEKLSPSPHEYENSPSGVKLCTSFCTAKLSHPSDVTLSKHISEFVTIFPCVSHREHQKEHAGGLVARSWD